MARRALVAVLTILCIASALMTLRSLSRLRYAFYTTTDNQSIGFVLAKGLDQLDLIDNGDIHPRNNGAWDGGSVSLAQPGWEKRFEASCAPAAVHFIAPSKRLGRLIPYECGKFVDPSNTRDASAPVPAVRLIIFPAWLFVLITGVIPIRWLAKWIWQKLHADPTRCPECGYDLRATPLRCPECGTLIGTQAGTVH